MSSRSYAPSPVKDATEPSTRSSKGPTCEPSSASLSVSTEATMWPVSASVARWSIFQARRRLVPCFSSNHLPGPHSRRPVLSTSRCTGSLPAFGRGTSSVSARRLRVEGSGTARSRPSHCRVWGTAPDADQAFGLAQRQAEHGTERQSRRDRQAGIAGLTAPAGARLSLPGVDRFSREPYGQAAPGAQARIVGRPVGDPVPLFRNVVPPVPVGFERHGRRPSMIEGSPPRQPTRRRPPGGPVQQGDPECPTVWFSGLNLSQSRMLRPPLVRRSPPEIDRALMVKGFFVLGVTLI